jgi:predicted CXXCH cytochrome family protein
MKKIIVAAAFALVASVASASISGSSHDFRGYQGIAASAPTCNFCHLPHGGLAVTGAPLWARNLVDGSAANGAYSFYAPVGAGQTKPTALRTPSQLCMSCHDGTQSIARILKINATGNAYLGGIANDTLARMPAASTAFMGTNLTNDHPVSVSFTANSTYGGLANVVPANIFLFNGTGMVSNVGVGTVECLSCHNAHTAKAATPSYPNRQFMTPYAGTDLCLGCHSTK